MGYRARILLKLLLAAAFVFLLVVFSASEYDFVYRAF